MTCSRDHYREWGGAEAEILRHLRTGPKSTHELSELMGRKCYQDVGRLHKKGAIEIVDRVKIDDRHWRRIYAISNKHITNQYKDLLVRKPPFATMRLSTKQE